MIGFRQILILNIVIVICSCESYRNIYFNYDRSIDFSRYKTFAWLPDSANAPSKDFENTPYDNDIVRNNAKNYVTHCLTHRGYLLDIDSPDVLMQLVLLNEKQERVITYHVYPYSGYYFNNGYYFPYYYPYYRFYTWYGWGGPPYWDEARSYTRTYVKGTITLNMFDRKYKKLVWTASAEGDIYDPVYVQYDVHPAIDGLLKKFPVKPVPRPKHSEDFMYNDRMARIKL